MTNQRGTPVPGLPSGGTGCSATVKMHVSRILMKLSLSNRVPAVLAHRAGLLDPHHEVM